MKKKLSLLLAALLAVSLFASCSNKSATAPPESPSASGAAQYTTIRVGMECGYAPYNWTQFEKSDYAVDIGGGEYADGYDVQIAKIIAEKLGAKLEIVKTEWDGLPPSLTSKKIDLVIAGMTDMPDRRETLDFTAPYWASDVILVVRKDGPYANATSLSDFAGAKVTGQMGTFHYDVIDKLEGVNKLEAMADFPTMLMALSSGKIDAYVAEEPTARAAEISNPEVTHIKFAPGEGFGAEATVSVGLRYEDAELKTKIDEILTGITAGQREELMQAAILRQPLGE